MSFQRIHQFKSQNPQVSSSNSQFAPRPLPAQQPQRPPTQAQIENQAFTQEKFEASGLQLKQQYGTITPVEQERLGLLQAKMDSFWTQRMEQTKAQPNLLEILIRNGQATPATVQPKLTIGQPNDRYEQEADRVAEQVMSMVPSSTHLQRHTDGAVESSDLPINVSVSHEDHIQRQDDTEEANQQPSVPFIFGNLTTYDQLAAAARFGIAQVQEDLRDAPPGHSVHTRAAEWIEGLRAWLPYLQQQGTVPLTAAAAAQAQLHLDEGIAIREAIANARRAVVQREMDRVIAEARAAAQQAERLKPHLNDSLRAAYRSGDSSTIASVASTIGTITDLTMGFHDLARQTTEYIASFRNIDIPAVGRYVTALNRLNRGLAAFNLAFSLKNIDIPAVGRYVTALNRLNRGLAAFNLAFSLNQTEATTEIEEGMRQVNLAAGAFSSLGTLASLPAHMGLYANLYLVPLTTAIMGMMSRLTGYLQQENDIWAEVFGEPLRYGVEPGGRPMWQFMVSVMRAENAGAVPQISGEVAEYLFEHREALEAGSGEEVPTEGWWFWEDIHSDRARRWVFRKRDRLWAMFYGNRSVPD